MRDKKRMSEEASPKLYDNKPRKAQLKQFRGQHKSNEFSSPAGMGTTGHAAAPPPPPPPPPPKEPFVRRYKYLWPMLLAVNLGVGAYLFMRTKNKDTGEEKDASPVTTRYPTAPVVETSASASSITNPVIKREPIPEKEQRELLKWILEEKRKVKPKDAEEKQKIDEEKALLKKLIRSKSIPNVK